MKIFLSQNGFAVTVFDSIPACGELKALPHPSVVIFSVFDSKLPTGDDLTSIRKASCAKLVYFLGNTFNRTEIGFLLRHEVNGFFVRPLHPLEITRKVKENLEEIENPPSSKKSGQPLESINVTALGIDQFSSQGWEILAKQVLSVEKISPILYAHCASLLIFRLFVQKLKRRLPSSVVFFLDGDETTIQKAILECIQHGQWRNTPVVAIYSPGGLTDGLAQFLLHELGLLRMDRDGIIQVILGGAVSPAQLAKTGRLETSTANRLQEAALELPSPEKFDKDLPKILRWRVRQFASQAGREMLLPPYPDDLFGDPVPTHTEIEALAQWISRKTAATGEIDEPTLRMVARHTGLLPDLLESIRTAKARSAAYLRDGEAALEFFSRSLPAS